MNGVKAKSFIDYTLCMRDRKEIYEALLRDMANGTPLTHVAREAEIPYVAVRQFKDTMSLGQKRIQALDGYLERKGLFSNNRTAQGLQPIDVTQAQDLMHVTAGKLFNLAQELLMPDEVLPRKSKISILKKQLEVVRNDLLPLLEARK